MIKPEILLKMLEISICGLIENEICSYCAIAYNKDERCSSKDLCADLIFEGLKKRTDGQEKDLRGRK